MHLLIVSAGRGDEVFEPDYRGFPGGEGPAVEHAMLVLEDAGDRFCRDMRAAIALRISLGTPVTSDSGTVTVQVVRLHEYVR